jgi:hypothetical protein
VPGSVLKIQFIRPIAFDKKEKQIGMDIATREVAAKAQLAVKALENLTANWNHQLKFSASTGIQRAHVGEWRRTVVAEVKPIGSKEAVMVFESLDQGLEEGEVEVASKPMFFTPTGMPDIGSNVTGTKGVKSYQTASGRTSIRSMQQRIDPFKPKTKPNSLTPQPTKERKKPGIATYFVMSAGIKPRNFMKVAMKLYGIKQSDADRITEKIERAYGL